MSNTAYHNPTLMNLPQKLNKIRKLITVNNPISRNTINNCQAGRPSLFLRQPNAYYESKLIQANNFS